MTIAPFLIEIARHMNLHQLFHLLIASMLALAFRSHHAPTSIPKREFRATWVATIHNIDWPSQKGLPPHQQQREFLELLDRQQQLGMNALIVQVRPSGDAFYQSAYEPWSEWLSGTQGQAPTPFYDPLAFMIDATHARGMEFHAWVNPFRGVSHTRFSSVSDQHLSRQRPDWFFQHGKSLYFNPGIPAVRNHLLQVIRNIVECYDVDGLHFDDYFYPYRKPGEQLPDWATFRQHGGDFASINDWRRHNIDEFVRQVADTLDHIKPHVKFGISPIGVWRNKRDDPRGSNTSFYAAYDMSFADVRKWLERGWIDYVAPQLYWSTEHPYANYKDLLAWWADNAFDRHLYIGQAMFKVNQVKSKWWTPSELPRQLRLNRNMPNVQGSVFYSANSFQASPARHQLREQFYGHPALVPAMPWKDAVPPLAPWGITLTESPQGVRIQWRAPAPAEDGETAHLYVVYGFPAGHPLRMEAPYIRSIQSDTVFVDTGQVPPQGYRYLVTALDRLKNESQAYAMASMHPIRPIATQRHAPPPSLAPAHLPAGSRK